jgi:outer membrane murein-binding lipoprotein Lpp/AraC-like DNA-binding protein
MAGRHKVVIAVVAALSVFVVGAAVAADRVLSPGQERQAVINDAARQLGVEPRELSDALEQALKNRVDAAVRDGRITEEEAAKLKERIDAGDAPLFGLGPGPGFRHDHRHGALPAKADAAARYLGMTQAELRSALEDGKTLAQIARDRGKSVAGLVDALVAPAEQKLNQLVEDGRVTQAEKRELLSRLREHLTDVVNGRFTPPHFEYGPDRAEFHKVRPAIF